MIALNSFGVEFSGDFKGSIIGGALYYDPDRIYWIPFSEISEKWLRGWKRC